MKILFLTNLRIEKPGGLLKASYERISRHQQHNDCYVINNNYCDSGSIRRLKKILGRKPAECYEEEYFEGNLKIKNINFQKTPKFFVKNLFQMEHSILEDLIDSYIKKYRNIISEMDIIHAHFGFPTGYIAYRLSRKFKIPYFITFHGSDINFITENNVPLLLESMEQAENCFFVSKQLCQAALELNYSGSNAEITYNGVDLNLFRIPEARKEQKNRKVAGFIGSLIRTKGADFLPEIFTNIASMSEVELDFVVVGDGELRTTLENECKERKLNVRFTGYVENDALPEILDDFDVLLVPSRNEGLGIVILEAYAMGIPVVGANVGGIPEAIGFEDNLVEAGADFERKMAEKAVELMTQAEPPEAYRQFVKENFDWDSTIATELSKYKAFETILLPDTK
ncbi:MAG: glycosyltransferase family 4 protein [Fastidiosipila sp.]|nr:glycosyltransferase family 4 protein [Fastidiosipila sp.]